MGVEEESVMIKVGNVGLWCSICSKTKIM